jgi:hypothetical protein
MQRTFNKALRKPYFRNGSFGVDITGGKLWTPAELGASLIGWWDASDSSTITISTGVSAITDKSGNSHTFSQVTGASQPALIANGQNALSIIRFDGSDDVMSTSSAITIRTLILLAKWTNTTGDFRHIWDADTSSVNGWCGDAASSGNLLSSAFASALVLNGDKYVNGTLTAGNLQRYTNWTIHGFQTTGNINVIKTGAQTGFPARGFLGDYAEFLYFDAVPSTTNRQLIEGYLAWKWALQASLPADHPYKNAAPTL